MACGVTESREDFSSGSAGLGSARLQSALSRPDSYRSARLAVVFALGEVEALAAALTRLLLFVLFPGALLESGGINKIVS